MSCVFLRICHVFVCVCVQVNVAVCMQHRYSHVKNQPLFQIILYQPSELEISKCSIMEKVGLNASVDDRRQATWR